MKMKKALLLILLLLAASILAPRPGAGLAPDSACTSFCLDNNGGAVYGTNYDFTLGRHDGMVFVNKRNVSKRFPEAGSPGAQVAWTSRFGSVTFNFVAGQAAWAGMNEAGLVVSLMRLEGSRAPAPDGRPWLHVQYWPQYVLDNFSSAAEVVAFASSVPVAASGRIPHYMVCDRSGRCVIVEFLEGKAVVHAGDGLPLKVLANTAYERSLAEWRAVAARRQAGEAVPPMGTSSRGRFIRAAERVAAFRPADAGSAVREAFAILAAVGGRTAAWASNWSVVFDAGSLRVHFKTIVWPQVRTIDLRKLDFSCRAPVKLIDVNERLSGDISGRLRDCSFRLHYGHALRAAKAYGLDMTPAELAEHVRLIESFPCGNPPEQAMTPVLSRPFAHPAVGPVDPGLPDHCTSFCLDLKGQAVFGANYDCPKRLRAGLVFINKRGVAKSFWESDPSGEHARWTSKYGSVSFNLVMGQLTWAGMNEAGLVISTMALDGSRSPAPDRRPWIWANYWVQHVLDTCATVEEAVAAGEALRIQGHVDHYLVSDRGGRCAAIEFLDGKMVRHAGADLPVKALANSTYDESLAEWEKRRALGGRGDTPLPANRSLRRFILAAERAAAFKAGDAESAVRYAFEALDEASGQRAGISPTLWSLVFDTQNLRVHFRTLDHPEIRFIDLKRLDFSCRAPVKMLDVNEKLAGDITSRLRDYSTRMHFDHASLAWKLWGSDVDATTLRRNIRFLESFPCVQEMER